MQQSALRSLAIVCDYMETTLFAIVYDLRSAICDPRSSAIACDHMETSLNNQTVSRQKPWAGNIAKAVTSNGKQFTVTREMLTAAARHLSITWLFYNKSLNDWSLGEQWILFPSNLNVSLDFVSGNIEILGKQNSLFPSGPVIKCLILQRKS